MTPVFADTSYYVALFSPSDAYHTAAVRLSRELRRPVVVTDFVLLELGNALARANVRQLFVDLLPHLRRDPSVSVIPLSSTLLDQGFDLFADRPDKDWSLTDCISFVVMDERGLSDALSSDRHFEQAGFSILLK